MLVLTNEKLPGASALAAREVYGRLHSGDQTIATGRPVLSLCQFQFSTGLECSFSQTLRSLVALHPQVANLETRFYMGDGTVETGPLIRFGHDLLSSTGWAVGSHKR